MLVLAITFNCPNFPEIVTTFERAASSVDPIFSL